MHLQVTGACRHHRDGKRQWDGRLLEGSAFLFAVLLALLLGLLSGCDGAAVSTSDLSIDLSVAAETPTVGQNELTVTVRDAAGKAVSDAEVQVEGNMNHAGMKPTFATLRETAQAGSYVGELEFTMGGDWILTVAVTTTEGTKAKETFNVRGVKVRPSE